MSLTTAQLSAATGIPEHTLRQWVHRKKLAPLRRGTRPLRFDERLVEPLKEARWRNEQRAAASWIGAACAEYDALVAADLQRVSRSR